MADPAQHRAGAMDRGQPVGGTDAVLERHDGGFRPDQRPGQFGRPFQVPQLDRDHDLVDHTDGRGVVGRPDLQPADRAHRAFDRQAVGLQGGQMGAPGDEGDVGPGRRQKPAEIPADPAGPDHGDTHPLDSPDAAV